jgi:Domain of unknown function (DUF4349)
MDTKFRFLDQLDRDLRDAAARETHRSAQGPRRGRPPITRRRPNVTAIAAAFVALLVLAGGIGFLASGNGPQPFSSADEAVTSGGSAAVAPEKEAFPPGVTEERSRRVALGFGQEFGVGNDSQQGAATLGGDTAADDAAAGAPVSSGPTTTGPDLSKVIRDGSITVVVPQDGFGEAFDSASAIAEEAGGFVLASSISQENQGTLTLRVPSRKLDGAVVKLRALGRLAELSLSGHDVTADFIDLKARLQVLQTQRELIVKLLNQSTSVGGQLSLSNRFADVQTQIEQIQGSLNVLNDKVDLATLRVTLREEGVAAAPDEDDIRNPSLGSAWDRAIQGFFGVIGAVVVGLGYLIPLLVLAGLVVLVRLAVRRRRAAS